MGYARDRAGTVRDDEIGVHTGVVGQNDLIERVDGVRGHGNRDDEMTGGVLSAAGKRNDFVKRSKSPLGPVLDQTMWTSPSEATEISLSCSLLAGVSVTWYSRSAARS